MSAQPAEYSESSAEVDTSTTAKCDTTELEEIPETLTEPARSSKQVIWSQTKEKGKGKAISLKSELDNQHAKKAEQDIATAWVDLDAYYTRCQAERAAEGQEVLRSVEEEPVEENPTLDTQAREESAVKSAEPSLPTASLTIAKQQEQLNQARQHLGISGMPVFQRPHFSIENT